MPRPKGKKYNDLSGKRLGKLLVIERDFSKDYPRPYFLCKCDCGKTKTICSSNLTRSTRPSRSCGCMLIESRKLSYGESNRRALYKKYKLSAKKRGIDFNLSQDDFLMLTAKDCVYCGKEPEMVLNGKRSYGKCVYNGVDRIDNKKGYELDNCVPCCKLCNRMKAALTMEEFLEQIKYIYQENLLWEEE